MFTLSLFFVVVLVMSHWQTITKFTQDQLAKQAELRRKASEFDRLDGWFKENGWDLQQAIDDHSSAEDLRHFTTTPKEHV